MADHDAEDRATLERKGIRTRRARKEISVGIQKVQDRLKRAGDGKPRLFMLKDSLVEKDLSLEERTKPTCTEEEIVNYVWPKAQDNRPIKEVPIDIDNHGMDCTRYAVMYVDNRSAATSVKVPW